MGQKYQIMKKTDLKNIDESTASKSQNFELNRIKNKRKLQEKVLRLMYPHIYENFKNVEVYDEISSDSDAEIDKIRTINFIPKALDYAFNSKCKHQGHSIIEKLQGVLYNENINCFTSWSEKQVRVFQAKSGDKLVSMDIELVTSSQSISALTYSHKHRIYIIATNDFKLHVFNELLYHVGLYQHQMRQVKSLHFYDSHNFLVAVGQMGCFVIDYRHMS